MANRKSGKELRKEYQDLLDKTKAMRKRIIKRAEDLIKRYPNVVVNDFDLYKLNIQAAMSIIEKIEEHIADKHPHQQTKMFNT